MNPIYRGKLEAEHQAQIMAVLEATTEELCRKQLARHIDLCPHRLFKMLRMLLAAGRVRMVRVERGNRYYRPGAMAAPLPTTKERIVAALTEQPATRYELEKKLGITYGYLNLRLNELHAARQIHIAKQVKEGQIVVLVWAAGDKPDAKRPKRMTSAQKYRRKLAKLAENLEWVEAREARERRQKAKEFVPMPDAFMAQFAGLFGSRPAA